MTIFDTTEIALTSAMRGAEQRQSVLAGNLANANTAGYVRKDVDFQTAIKQALESQSPGTADSALEDASFTTVSDPGAVQPDGNGVDVDTESAAIAQNGELYNALASVASSRISILESAIGGSTS